MWHGVRVHTNGRPCGCIRRVQVLNYAGGSHVRTIGSKSCGNGQFETPLGGIAIDCDGRIIVCDSHNHRIQVFLGDAVDAATC